MHAKGIHIMWTRPKREKNAPFFRDYELLILAYSAIAFKTYNKSKLIMYTDTPGLKYFEEKDLLWLWDEVNTEVLDEFEKGITFSAVTFQNAGKSEVLAKCEVPFVYLDNDAVVYEEFKKESFDHDIAYAHFESINFKTHREYYIPYDEYMIPEGYSFNKDYCWETSNLPNSSVLILTSQKLQDDYRKVLYEYLDNNQGAVPEKYRLAHYLLIDQRFFGLIANLKGYSEFSLVPGLWHVDEKKWVFDNERKENADDYITRYHHLWFRKVIYDKFPLLQKKYTQGITNDLKDYLNPDLFSKIQENKSLKIFF